MTHNLVISHNWEKEDQLAQQRSSQAEGFYPCLTSCWPIPSPSSHPKLPLSVNRWIDIFRLSRFKNGWESQHWPWMSFSFCRPKPRKRSYCLRGQKVMKNQIKMKSQERTCNWIKKVIPKIKQKGKKLRLTSKVGSN